MHPFDKLTELIKEYDAKKESFDKKELQNLRDNISLNFFYLSDSISRGISGYDAAEHIRKTKQSERELYYRKEGLTVSECENKARLDIKEEALKSSEALRVKERVKIIVTSVPHILNSISTRLSNIK